MKNLFFPTTIIDNFFEDPDSVRNFGLMQEFPVEQDNFPGARTKLIAELNPLLYQNVVSKFMNLFFPNEKTEINATSQYQLVDSRFGSGWIHRDTPYVVTGIIYLNKDPKNFSGTSLYEKKQIFIDKSLDKEFLDLRKKTFKERTNNKELQNQHNSMFTEVLNVKGLYNRALFFDGHLYHGAHDFMGVEKEESRLTIITFFDKIMCNMYPIQRIHKHVESII